jgi:hypothetical protein
MLSDVSEFERLGTINKKLQSVDGVFDNMIKLDFDEQDVRKLLNGVRLSTEGMDLPEGSVLRLYSKQDGFFALGEVAVINQRKVIKAVKLFL